MGRQSLECPEETVVAAVVPEARCGPPVQDFQVVVVELAPDKPQWNFI
jgi:hypothetical protein